MKEITFIADTNDLDFITTISEISEADLEKIKPLIQAIKDFQPYETNDGYMGSPRQHDYNFPTGDCLEGKPVEEIYPGFSEEVWEIFHTFVPSSEHGIHTLETIYITPIQEKTYLL